MSVESLSTDCFHCLYVRFVGTAELNFLQALRHGHRGSVPNVRCISHICHKTLRNEPIVKNWYMVRTKYLPFVRAKRKMGLKVVCEILLLKV